MTKGTYLLLVELERSQSIEVGALGDMRFSRGFYTYVGSAMNGLEVRVARHLRRGKKRRWHIDFLVERASVYDVLVVPGERRLECALAARLVESLLCVPGFGASDCGCPGHLFFATTKTGLEKAVTQALAELDADWQRWAH